MTRIYLETRIQAPPERCFDLARSVDLHVGSMARSGERTVAGVTAGLMGLSDTVTWEARHLGFARRLTSRITAYDRPRGFVDEQVEGPFAWLVHQHQFRPLDQGTLMIDDFRYGVPYGPLGALADHLILARYMRRLLRTRNDYLKRVAEASEGSPG